MKTVLVLLVMIVSSCELHEQSAYSQTNDIEKTFDISEQNKLFKTITDDDYLTLKKFLDKDPNLALSVNSEGESLLNNAVRSKRLLSVYTLVKLGADTAYRNGNGDSAFELVEKSDFSQDHKNYWEDVLRGGEIAKPLLDISVADLIDKTAQDQELRAWQKLEMFFSLGADINAMAGRYTLLGAAASKPLPIITNNLCRLEDIDMTKVSGRFLKFIKGKIRRDAQFQEVYNILVDCGAR